ncbi:aldolase/citrate lyase family protein [Pigmentiphaga sp.]|uniref:HpcH/HpaI aldolase family protein n=1 Tax=Pigmentiphaga sp. TaxID=1977564 RepID=UPI00128D880B|nr:aldolase/citrate lyase family protein [Pigmentiphaga sp.]MPS27459.1 hypothetical protein [Alcaligenaceae bacterium SAGV5]MPS50585.1 hypothetical protein [Alcaligenaceae bacterium SAGV3]MPT55655.1 hypothetical protein [Alcaligenaceae bacterium]
MKQPFHEAIRQDGLRFGLFVSLNSAIAAEALAPSGFDYVVIDAEHSPLTPAGLHGMLTAFGTAGPEAIVRAASHDTPPIQQYLDLGVRTLIFPNVRDAADARRVVAATRYPPQGHRGVAGTIRASRYGRDKSYLGQANDHIVVLAQIESRAGLANLDEIVATDGVDGIYFGPNDMAADHGDLGQPMAAANVERLTHAIRRVRELGKIAGILCAETQLELYASAGATLFAFASDASLLVKAADELAARHAGRHPGERRHA